MKGDNMEHTELDKWVELTLNMSDKSKVIYSSTIDNMKTSIIHNSHSNSLWIHQSSMNVDGFETGVDLVLLDSELIEVIKNKC
jgi:hypothetical protein